MFRVGDRLLAVEYGRLIRTHPIEVAFKQAGFLRRGQIHCLVLVIGNRLADANIDTAIRLLEHFPHQPERGQGFCEKREGIEKCRITPINMHRQNRRLGSGGNFQKSVVPVTVMDAFGSKARHLASGEYQQGSLTLQKAADGAQVFARCIAVHVIDRQ